MAFTNIENTAKVVYHDTFDGRGFTDQNSLVNALLTKPDQLDPVLTHLMGRYDKQFPLSFLSEGYEGSKGIQDVQYTYDVINKLDKADMVVSSQYTTGDKPGLNGTNFFVTFKTNWLKTDHIVESQNDFQARVVNRPVQVGLYYKYELQPMYDGRFEFCPLSELVPGTPWAMVGGAPVSESLSMGNESNFVAPGKMKNQLSFLRKSWRLGGNVSNRTVECKFNIGGKQTNLWVAFEQWQFMIKWKQAVEEHLWYSRYNRKPDGSIPTKDPKTGLPIPIGAGVLDQIPNNDTYSKLTARKIKDVVRDVMFGASDTEKMDVRLFTGTGGAEEFDDAMKDEAKAMGFIQDTGNKFVTGEGYNIALGGYFTQYHHKDGHKITVQHLPLLDLGSRANKAPRHPVTSLPMTSYEMYFIDMSTYDGQKNVQMYHQEGRAMKTGILQGMADTPYSFGGNKMIALGTEQDSSHIHFMCSKSICIRRNTHCFTLRCDLAD
jgi:hypothetical protein